MVVEWRELDIPDEEYLLVRAPPLREEPAMGDDIGREGSLSKADLPRVRTPIIQPFPADRR